MKYFLYKLSLSLKMMLMNVYFVFLFPCVYMNWVLLVFPMIITLEAKWSGFGEITIIFLSPYVAFYNPGKVSCEQIFKAVSEGVEQSAVTIMWGDIEIRLHCCYKNFWVGPNLVPSKNSCGIWELLGKTLLRKKIPTSPSLPLENNKAVTMNIKTAISSCICIWHPPR